MCDAEFIEGDFESGFGLVLTLILDQESRQERGFAMLSLLKVILRVVLDRVCDAEFIEGDFESGFGLVLTLILDQESRQERGFATLSLLKVILRVVLDSF